MNVRGPIEGRIDNSEKIKWFMKDSENTMTYTLDDHRGNKFFGQYNKLVNLQNSLYYENKEKYLNEYQAKFNASLEIGSVPICFNSCVKDVLVPGGLSSDEKNCMRECYFKRVTTRDDMATIFHQKKAFDMAKTLKEINV